MPSISRRSFFLYKENLKSSEMFYSKGERLSKKEGRDEGNCFEKGLFDSSILEFLSHTLLPYVHKQAAALRPHSQSKRPPTQVGGEEFSQAFPNMGGAALLNSAAGWNAKAPSQVSSVERQLWPMHLSSFSCLAASHMFGASGSPCPSIPLSL